MKHDELLVTITNDGDVYLNHYLITKTAPLWDTEIDSTEVVYYGKVKAADLPSELKKKGLLEPIKLAQLETVVGRTINTADHEMEKIGQQITRLKNLVGHIDTGNFE